MHNKIYRQGDVLIRQIALIPSAAKDITPKNDRIVLAYGEVTGHAHAIAPGEASEFTFADAGGIVRRFLSVLVGGASVKHEEHSTIPLPPGVYEIVQQREYHPDEIRNVDD